MFENPGLSSDYVKQVEQTADPDLRKRIIYGEFAEVGDRYFTLEQIGNAVDDTRYWRKETGIIEEPDENAEYIISADFAASNDRSVFGVFRYDLSPVRLVALKFFKGKEVPIPMQYQILRELYWKYAEKCKKIKLTFDAQALGGKIAEQNLKELHGQRFPPEGESAAEAKAQALGALKALFDEGRQFIEVDGVRHEVNDLWGGISIPNIRPLRMELEGYKVKDDKIRNDFVIMMAQAAFYIVKHRKPKDYVRVRSVNMYENFTYERRSYNV